MRIPESRAILIHFGGGRNWTIGCLIPTKSPYKGYHKKYGKIYKCDIEKSKRSISMKYVILLNE